MSLETLTPRTADQREAEVLATYEAELFQVTAGAVHSPSACISTCVTGLTIKCDGSTFNQTCTTGLTLRCDG